MYALYTFFTICIFFHNKVITKLSTKTINDANSPKSFHVSLIGENFK